MNLPGENIDFIEHFRNFAVKRIEITFRKNFKMDKHKKQGRYERILLQLEALLEKDNGIIARMATINAVLHHKLKEGELIVGPYQGPVACQVLAKNTGVCWAAVNESQSVIVPDVEKFQGHIACDSRSKSEITVPVKNKEGKIIAVMDVDSSTLDSFDETDQKYLEQIVKLIF